MVLICYGYNILVGFPWSLLLFCHICSQHQVAVLEIQKSYIKDNSENIISLRVEVETGKPKISENFYNLLHGIYHTTSQEKKKKRIKRKDSTSVFLGPRGRILS